MAQWHLNTRIHEDLLRTVIERIRAQRPSVFNAATKSIVDNPTILCSKVPQPANGAPQLSILEPLVVGETKSKRLLLNYSLQLGNFAFDFAPGNGLGTNQFRFSVSVTAGLGSPETVESSFLLFPESGSELPNKVDVFLPFDALSCFSFEFDAIGIAQWTQRGPSSFLAFQLVDIDLGDAAKASLLKFVRHYLLVQINAAMLPGLAFKVETLELSVGEDKKVLLPLLPTAGMANPILQNDTLSAFIDIH